MLNTLLQGLFAGGEPAAVFSARSQLQGMLDFEAALARAQARIGLVPAACAEAIAARCHADLFDLAELAAATATAGNPAIPMVSRLTALVAKDDAAASRYVHWGATSQDVIDTGMVLQLRTALEWLSRRLTALADELAVLAERHRDTPMVGRTLLQHALPITFGLKVAGWLSAIERHRERLAGATVRARVLQFGGAAGTLAALGERGLDVAQALAGELDLEMPDVPWHTHRDRFAEVGNALALLTGTLGKMARDVALLMQVEVGEAFESRRANDSSTLPQKNNPVAAATILAAAHRAPGLAATLMGSLIQEHERAVGGWPAEWTTLPELFTLTAGAVDRSLQMVAGLTVDAQRMRTNLDLTRGAVLAEAVTMALGTRMGRLEAHELVRDACRRAEAENRSLREVLEQMPDVRNVLTAEQLERLFDPVHYTGASGVFVDRVLARRR